MIRFLFVLSTILVGVLIQVILGHYISFFDAAPQAFLLMTVANGFVFGPLMGEVLGFSWGLIADATGYRMFGMNALLLALAGYLAGNMRRRVASERVTAQIVIALVATLYYTLGVSSLYSIFDETGVRVSIVHFILEAIFNGLFAAAFFILTERWIILWRLPQEHM